MEFIYIRYRLFYNCKSLRDTNLTSIYMNGYNEHKLYAKKNILLNKIDYPSYLDCTKYMFYCCKSLIKIPYLECKYCISIESMFENCESITNIDLDKFQFIVGGSTYHYFNEDVHNKAFKDCHKVTKIWISNLYLIEALDYNDNCDNHEFVEKTYKFEDTFKNCKNLKQISLAGYNPSRGIFNKERVDDISKNLENAKNKMIKNSKLKNDIVVKIDRSTERNCYRF